MWRSITHMALYWLEIYMDYVKARTYAHIFTKLIFSDSKLLQTHDDST